MTQDVHVGILGASGFGGGELLRLLVQHPRVRVVGATSESNVGARIESMHPHLFGFYDFPLSAELDLDRLLSAERCVVFAALPHGASGAAAGGLLDRLPPGRSKVIDLSGDLRLKDPDAHARHYPGSPLLEAVRGRFAYGLAELNRDAIRSASAVANPGCLATAAILSCAPLVADGFEGSLIVDAKTGSSGSGKQLRDTTHHPTRHADHRAYRPLAHQHEPEILQALGDPLGGRIRISFVPQSLAVSRGIFVTTYLSLPREETTAAVTQKYRDFYSGSPFIRIRSDSPTLQDVVGSNFCDIAVFARGREVVAMAAIDNLVKGMAGAAIQNMNLMLGLPETTGLWQPSLRPV